MWMIPMFALWPFWPLIAVIDWIGNGLFNIFG